MWWVLGSLIFWTAFLLGMVALSQVLDGEPVVVDRLDVIGAILLSCVFTAVGVAVRWVWGLLRRWSGRTTA